MTESPGTNRVEVSLDEVVTAMDLPGDDLVSYLNRRTGELVTVTEEDLRAAESDTEPADASDWQAEMVAKAREVLQSDDFLALPDKFEIHEYAIMERFCWQVEDEPVRNALLARIRGRGAFRRFRELLSESGITDQWYAYRQHALEEIAAEWLEANGIAYVRGLGRLAPDRL